MTVSVKNIFCVGRNYRLHAQELNNAVPTEPIIFAKPTHSLAEAKGNELILPGAYGEVHHELELVVHVAKAYEPGLTVEELVDRVALGIDFTLRDVQNELKEKRYPWLKAKGFKNAAVLTPWFSFKGLEEFAQCEFSLEKNGVEVQRGTIKDMIFDIRTLLEYVYEYFGLGEGDIIFTGTPAGVGAVADGDHLVLKRDDRQQGDFVVRLK
ncbi:fumarylacetoacetate hydrolase family protein [Desulfitobacterium hafniense]|uniref:fumarylacetoacetate hydrolase family protein n=1 Tax=Desulfitobacterium hafniense TaxID=49338 RepID=UPI000365E3D7|nr:fumarylacetoacetate hydrolase family protein [Desulfitobacterium hafniense]